MGDFPFIGYIDEGNKTIYSFSDSPNYSHFDQAYQNLVDEYGYKRGVVATTVKQQFMAHVGLAERDVEVTGSKAVYDFLYDEKRAIMQQVEAILAGKVDLVAGITATDKNRVQGLGLSGEYNAVNQSADYQLDRPGASFGARIGKKRVDARFEPQVLSFEVQAAPDVSKSAAKLAVG